jgi:fructose-1,6-bisphosphatase/sedoheptulose 1,7-bisphosphatase-like protein
LLDLVPAKDLVVGICGITCGDLVAGVEQQDDGTRLTSSLLFRLGQVVPVSHRISYPTLVP